MLLEARMAFVCESVYVREFRVCVSADVRGDRRSLSDSCGIAFVLAYPSGLPQQSVVATTESPDTRFEVTRGIAEGPEQDRAYQSAAANSNAGKFRRGNMTDGRKSLTRIYETPCARTRTQRRFVTTRARDICEP